MATESRDYPSQTPATHEAGPRPLHDMFAGVPRRYDLLNRALTWGFDERWRRRAARECLSGGPGRVLDLCCGTGDLALHVAKLAADGVEVVGADFCEPMLEVARRKATARGLEGRVSFVPGDAASLPFPDGHFDALGISFAFRNLSYRNPLTRQYLVEMRRVLAPGGRCIIVETSQPPFPLLRAAYHLYLRTVVPRLGGLISGRRGAYRYLAESARRFHRPEEVSRMLLEAGFREARFVPLLWGIAGIHVAVK